MVVIVAVVTIGGSDSVRGMNGDGFRGLEFDVEIEA
jgi:hypothetical protein